MWTTYGTKKWRTDREMSLAAPLGWVAALVLFQYLLSFLVCETFGRFVEFS